MPKQITAEQLVAEQLDVRYPTTTLSVPKAVWAEDGWLVWRLAALKSETREARLEAMVELKRVRAGTRLLQEFIALADAPVEHIVAFARRWGVLGLCGKHGRPTTHQPLQVKGRSKSWRWDICALMDYDVVGGKERIDRWHYYASRAAFILRVAQRARDKPRAVPSQEEIETLGFGALDRSLVARPGGRTPMLTVVVNLWLEEGDVRPQLITCRPPGASTLVIAPIGRIAPSELFGTIGMQLALAVSGERGLAFCHSCGNAFEPARALVAGRRHFCRDCGRKAMVRAAKADYRASLRFRRRTPVKSPRRRGGT